MPTRPLLVRYAQDLKLLPDRWQQVGAVAWAVVLLAFPAVANANWLTIANLSCVAVVGAVALMILTGFTGQISLGHAAFLALGAYTAAIGGTHLGLPFWLLLPAAGLVAAAVGLAIGPFALRLEGLYLAIVTLGLIFLVNHVLLSYPQWSGGVAGIAVPMHWGFGGDAGFATTTSVAGVRLDAATKLYVLFVALALVTVWMGKNVARSNLGRAMAAVRDHDLAAAVMGVRPAVVKVTAFALSSFFAGVAGAMFAFQQQFITIDPPFNLGLSVQYIAMIVLGGMGTIFGAVAGALTFTMVEPLLHHVGRDLPLLRELSSAQQSTLLFAVLIIGFLLFEPLGLLGIWLRVKRYFAAWPFRY